MILADGMMRGLSGLSGGERPAVWIVLLLALVALGYAGTPLGTGACLRHRQRSDAPSMGMDPRAMRETPIWAGNFARSSSLSLFSAS